MTEREPGAGVTRPGSAAGPGDAPDPSQGPHSDAVAAAEPGPPAETAAEPGPPAEVLGAAEPTLVEEFGVLAGDMRGTMVGSPRQRVTGLIFLVLLFFAAMLGLAALRDSGALGSPASPSPSAGASTVRPA